MTDTIQYTLGLLAEECGEVVQEIGKAWRFGLTTPTTQGSRGTAHDHITTELGDVLAAIRYAAARGVVDLDQIEARAEMKLTRLLDPDSRDNLGRRLAP